MAKKKIIEWLREEMFNSYILGVQSITMPQDYNVFKKYRERTIKEYLSLFREKAEAKK